MNIEALSDSAVTAKHVAGCALCAASILVAEHSDMTVSPRRFAAGVAMLTGLGVVRLSSRLLPVDSPTRIFMCGMVDGVPMQWRDLLAFSRRRPTPSGAARTP